MSLTRAYHPWYRWEEIDHNMWGEVSNRQAALELAIAFTSDHREYGKYMRLVTKQWPISCENALTDSYINQRAWIGHAACALAHKIPEDIVRDAWRHLTSEQQLLANQEASRAIQSWQHDYQQNTGVRHNVGETLLFEWNT